MKQVILEAAEERQASLRGTKERAKSELARIDKQIQELIRMRSQELITNEEFITSKATLVGRRRALGQNDDDSQANPDQIRKKLDEIMADFLRIPELWERLAQPKRRRFQRILFPTGFVNGKIGTAELGLLFRISGQFSSANPDVVALVRQRWNQIMQEIEAFSVFLKEVKESTTGRDERFEQIQ